MACRKQGAAPPPQWSSGLPDSAKLTLEAWFFCDECNHGERASARALGDAAVSPSDRILRNIPGQWQTNLRLRYGTAAKRAQLTGADSIAYVNRYLGNFAATVQSRAGFLLGDIKSSAAITVLRDALQDTVPRRYRPDVIRDLHRAYLAATTTALPGVYQPKVLAFIDTVWVRRPGDVPWDGDELVMLNGAPFPQDVGAGLRRANTELGVVAAALPGEYAFSVANVGPAQESQFGEVRITTFPAAPPTTMPDLTAVPLPLTMLFSLSRSTTPPDPVHFFKFQPTNALTVTATADWTGPSQIGLVWEDCSHRQGVAASRGTISGIVLDATGNSLGGVRVGLIGSTLEAITTPGGTFEVVGVPPGWTGRIRISRIGFATVELWAWDGAANYFIVLPLGAGLAPVVSNLTTGPRPHSASQTIPPGACRLLGVLKTDTSSELPIVRLRIVVSP